MSFRKKIHIFSTDSFLPYQPSILNLYDTLKEEFDVRITSFNYYNRFAPVKGDYNATYVRVPWLPKKFYFGINILIQKAFVPLIKVFNKAYTYQNDLFKAYLVRRAVRYLRGQPPADEIIAVDFVALSAVQKVHKEVLLMSLEIYVGDKYKAKCDLVALKAIIQPSKERYEYVFGNLKKRLFIVPNAPTYKEYERTPPGEREGLIWPGTIDYNFGVHYAIRFLYEYPEYTLTLKGAFVQGAEDRIRNEFADLIQAGRLIINTEYLGNDAFISFISRFKMSFCFYDWDVIKRNINYWLAPAGRLFMSYSAGVPVIACNTPGLSSITEFGAGVQIDDYEPATIKAAIDTISGDYEHYAAAAITAAKAHSFAESCLLLIAYLKGEDAGATVS